VEDEEEGEFAVGVKEERNLGVNGERYVVLVNTGMIRTRRRLS